ncbi:MAG: cytochrome-c peroxidase [Verrucomicrobiales bacterium]|nr:cytochrome-c peroxidase [Verrucomicrobiales bacterium]MCP5527614.1 cytochrome-c peroxidase [Verrucomicrobiales bacterium]
MKTKAILMTVALAAGLPALMGQNISELRDQAKLLFGPLPDKMPGSEKDTPARIELGRKLYFDKQLSVNNSQACNSCHMLDNNRAGVDNQRTSLGAHGKRGDRNSPTTLNAGFHLAQFWDGRAKDLQEQAKGPVLNPVEMAMPDEATVVQRLTADSSYKDLFASAFPNASERITYDNVAEAIAAFERTLITHDRFDDFMNGDDKALSETELKGLELFMSVGCITCHMSPTMGGNMYQKIGLINPYENTEDKGRFSVTKDENDMYKFKVPSLRNIALTFPYFHDGALMSLRDAVKKMAHMQLGRELEDGEADLLVAFLKTLSDKKLAP